MTTAYWRLLRELSGERLAMEEGLSIRPSVIGSSNLIQGMTTATALRPGSRRDAPRRGREGDPDRRPLQRGSRQGPERDSLRGTLLFGGSPAISWRRDNNLPIVVFDMDVNGNILKAVDGESIRTLAREPHE